VFWDNFKPTQSKTRNRRADEQPVSRNFLQSAASLLPIDYSAVRVHPERTDAIVSRRDTGFQVKGYVLKTP